MSHFSSFPKIFIIAAKRTPFGAFGGSLKSFTANELGGLVSKALLDGLKKEVNIDAVIFGNVAQTSSDAAYLARHVSHRAGLPYTVPALTVNRLCGSGFEAVIQGAQACWTYGCHLTLVGGTENMSQSPYALRHVRFGEGVKYGQDLVMEDTLASALVDRFPEPVSMGMTAENLAEQYQVSREDCDAYALLSQQRWQKAHQQNLFQSELVPIPLPSRPRAKKGPPSDPTPASSSSSSSSSLLFSVDEHPKPTTTLEGLAKLPPVFKKQGTVTAGNASGISDGAAALLVGTEQALQAHPEFTPLARMVGWSVVGVHPSKMGIGPVPAIRQVLKKVGLTLSQMDLIEINEAFAAQYLAVEKELQLNRDLTNPHGGAIALGHPLAASGARIVAHLAHQLHASSSKMQYALGAACIGGGQGIAVVLEKV